MSRSDTCSMLPHRHVLVALWYSRQVPHMTDVRECLTRLSIYRYLSRQANGSPWIIPGKTMPICLFYCAALYTARLNKDNSYLWSYLKDCHKSYKWQGSCTSMLLSEHLLIDDLSVNIDLLFISHMPYHTRQNSFLGLLLEALLPNWLLMYVCWSVTCVYISYIWGEYIFFLMTL